MRISPVSRWLLILALFNVVLHLAFYKNLGYHRDELLYFSLGQHPAWGYASVPPLIGWISAIIFNTIGYSVFAARLVPAVAGGLMVLLVARLVREMGGNAFAKILAAVAFICTPFALRTYFLFQPVFLDITFWTLIFFFVLRYINTRQAKYLLILGLVSGLAMLNKYLVGILIVALLLSFLATRHRIAFRQRSMYYGLGVALLIMLPNLIWQLNNNLPVVQHMQELSNTQLRNVTYSNFLAEQLLMPFAATLLTLPGLLYLLFSKRVANYRLLAISALLVVTMLLLLHGKSYYTLGIFPMLIAAGAVFYEHVLRPQWLRWALPLLLITLTIPVLPLGLPVYSPEKLVVYFDKLENNYGIEVGRRFEDGTQHSLPQDYADMLGWETIAVLVKQAYQRVPEGQQAIIYAENYGQAGAVSIVGQQWHLPQPLSFSDTYLYWAPEAIPHSMKHFIYINDELGADVRGSFNQIELVGVLDDPFAREYGTKVYLCTNPKESLNALWQQALARFGRNQ